MLDALQRPLCIYTGLAATPNLLILRESDLGAWLTARARIPTYTDLYVWGEERGGEWEEVGGWKSHSWMKVYSRKQRKLTISSTCR